MSIVSRNPFAGYAREELPLGSYAALVGLYGMIFGTLFSRLRTAHRSKTRGVRDSGAPSESR